MRTPTAAGYMQLLKYAGRHHCNCSRIFIRIHTPLTKKADIKRQNGRNCNSSGASFLDHKFHSSWIGYHLVAIALREIVYHVITSRSSLAVFRCRTQMPTKNPPEQSPAVFRYGLKTTPKSTSHNMN